MYIVVFAAETLTSVNKNDGVSARHSILDVGFSSGCIFRSDS